MKKAKKLTIKTHKGSETGKFGRILGEIFADGVNLNLSRIAIDELSIDILCISFQR